MQEIITQVIVAVCVLVSLSMVYRRFWGKNSTKSCNCGCDGENPDEICSCREPSICDNCALYDSCLSARKK